MAAEKLGRYREKRDFDRTPEPAGGDFNAGSSKLRFVIQKHAASHLHFDLRLEMEGVMKSWAVPKGPSTDPTVKRLAMEVEDHPTEYNDFEGTIPKGEYGGGTVMVWDRGTYAPVETRRGESEEAALLRALRAGRLAFELAGERLHGRYTLVRTGKAEGGRGRQWFLINRSDEAAPEGEVTERFVTSVVTGRTMDEIAGGVGGDRVWHSNRSRKTEGKEHAGASRAAGELTPMLATGGAEIPRGAGWWFEPKYDGIRILAFGTSDTVALVTRNGNRKNAQFPEIEEAVRELSRRCGTNFVLDGELVAVKDGRLRRFGSLQGRMHLSDAARVRALSRAEPAALVVFDALLIGEEPLLSRPLGARRERLEELVGGWDDERVLLSETSDDVDLLMQRARREGWEGLIAKRVDRPYRPGARTRDWLKIKLEHRQELVIGGWTDPRGARGHLGALLLGHYDVQGRLVYAGHTGTGFDHETLRVLRAKLGRLERKTSPFQNPPKTNRPAHWVTPRLVAEIRFNEWTADGKLRHPVFMGLRDDREPSSVRREPHRDPDPSSTTKDKTPAAPRKRAGGAGPPGDRRLLESLAALTEKGGGTFELPPDGAIPLTNLGKVYFPGSGITKGEVIEFYTRMADLILPWMGDRPLVLKRFPNGIEEEAFYQQAAPDQVPPGVRAEEIVEGDGDRRRRFIGGDLGTLLYTIQLGAISYDPWHSRMGSQEFADYTILDLDPGPGASFQKVVQVARWVREEMDGLQIEGALKTSGSSGLHIYLPLPSETPVKAATLIAQIIATRVAKRHPREATITRMRNSRKHGTIYVDYLQNILGKTVAGVYAVRAKPGATVSTPLQWSELTDDLDLRDFTIRTVPARVAETGDLWAQAMAKPIALDRLLELGGT